MRLVHKHGFGVWKRILDDAEGNLYPSVLEELQGLERPEEWIMKRVEGLDKAFRIAEDHEKATRQRESAMASLKRKLISRYNDVSSFISRRTREPTIDYNSIIASYKDMFADIMHVGM